MPRRPQQSVALLIVVALIPLIFGPLLYAALGFYTNATNTSIYSDIPSSGFGFGRTVTFSIANRNPYSFPFVNGVYSIQVTLVNATKTTCVWFDVTGQPPCKSTAVDLGTINSGDTKGTSVLITTDGEQFGIKIMAVMKSLLGAQNVQTLIFTCRSIGNAYNYTCTS